jgi:hypothetical protein
LKLSELPRFPAAHATGHEPFPEPQPSTRSNIQTRALLKVRIGERNERFEIKPKFGAFLNDHMGSLNRRSILGRVHLRCRLLGDPDTRAALDSNRACYVIATKQSCRALHQDEIDDRRVPVQHPRNLERDLTIGITQNRVAIL